jgi:hypothetical protein
MLSSDEVENEFYQTLKELPIERAIDRLQEPIESKNSLENLCTGICIIANRLKAEKPNGYPKHLQRLVGLLLGRNYKSYQWSGYGVRLAYQALVPLVRDSIRFELLEKVIENLDFDTEERIWLDSAAEKLDDFCRFRALATGSEDLTVGLRRLLNLHEMWIQGNGYLPNMRRIELPDVQKLDSVPQTWSEFAVRYFFLIMQSDNLTRIELALRGLWSLAQIAPADLGYIAQNWSGLNYSPQERVLLLIERAAASAPLAYEPFSEIVRTCYEGVDLGLKLQAWVILKVVERRTGEGFPEWQLPVPPEQETFLSTSSAGRGVLDIPSIPRGVAYELHGSDIVLSLLRRLEGATMEDLDDVERKYVAYTEAKPHDIEHAEPLAINRGQMRVHNLPHRTQLMKVIYHELFRGRWKDTSLVAIGQALLKSDEPFISLQSPFQAVNAEEWAIDHVLEQLSSNKSALMDGFLPHIQAGVSNDEVVLGAVLHSYSWSTDVEVVFDTVLRDRGFELMEANTMTTMNGRTFALYSDDRFDPQDVSEPILRMTYNAGGIGEFNNQSMLCYPSLIWTNLFRWYPSADNPFVWLEDGNRIIRFEHLHGPVRDITQDQLHRQPFLQRWVCSKETFEKIKSKLEVTVSPVLSVKVRKVRY